MTPSEAIRKIEEGGLDGLLVRLYTEEGKNGQKARYANALKAFASLYGDDREISIFSAPGRTEIIGNHTDHNRGQVVAASVNLDVIVVAAKNRGNVIRLQSQGHEPNYVELADLAVKEEERETSNALIRGICARFRELGFPNGGFDAYTTSDVLRGSGLSSSAAFEVAVGTVLNHLYADGAVTPVQLAQIGQYAENVYFGKPCGLMDQTACSVGGFVSIDFKDPGNPEIHRVNFDFSKCGYDLCIVNTGGNHADLTEDYASVPTEMKRAAGFFGRQVLREVDEGEFWSRLGELRQAAGDRAAIRAIHFFEENRRAGQLAQALENEDFDAFQRLILESGRSSFMFNQNVYTVKNVAEQGLSLALAAAEHLLGGKGSFRVHGGGFAGTIQAFVPHGLTPAFQSGMDAIFGQGACQALCIRSVGGCAVL